MNVCFPCLIWAPWGQAPGSLFLSVSSSEASLVPTDRKKMICIYWGSDTEISNTAFNYQSVLNQNDQKMDLDTSQRVLERCGKGRVCNHQSGISTDQSQRWKKLRTRIQHKISLLVNKFISLSLTVLRMIYAFRLFSSSNDFSGATTNSGCEVPL